MKATLKHSLLVLTSAVLLTQLFGCHRKEDPTPPATITGFNPMNGEVGTVVTITGSFFDEDIASNIVKFNGIVTTVTNATATELTVTVPTGATTGKITVSVRDATAVSSADFNVVTTIKITSFSPTSGALNDIVTITGDNFDPTPTNNLVKFNGVAAKVLTASKTALSVELANGGDSGQITVTVGGKTGTSTSNFMYEKKWYVSDFAGSGSDGYSNGTGASASFSNMTNLAIDATGNIYMADELNNLIRKITPAAVTTTVAGTGSEGHQDGAIDVATFYNPVAVAIDGSGNIFICDSFNNTIRMVDTSNQVSTIAGQLSAGSANGTGTSAQFNNPHGVCVDSKGNLFIADNLNNRIRKITPEGVVTTFAGQASPGSTNGTGTAASFYNPWALTIDHNDNLYVADTYNNRIRKITPLGAVTTLAGSGLAGAKDGQGTAATFNAPTGISVDRGGNVFVVDHGGSTIRMITSTGLVATIAGTSSVEGDKNGVGAIATFSQPYSVVNNADGDLLYIADQGNRKVRKMVYR